MRYWVAACIGLAAIMAGDPAFAACTDPPAPGVNWGRCYMDEQNLAAAMLSRANLREARFNRAGMAGADLSNIDARRAKFVSADLTGAKLEGADLRETDFTRASLREARLNGADLRRARLFRADLRGARFNRRQSGTGRFIECRSERRHLDQWQSLRRRLPQPVQVTGENRPRRMLDCGHDPA